MPESHNGQNNCILYMWPVILICFWLTMLGVNYIIYGCSSAGFTPGVSLYQNLTLKEKIVAVNTQDRVINDNSRKQIKNQTLCT